MSETPLLSLPILEASQAQKHVTHNEALLLLDAAIQLSVKIRGATAPPMAPAAGDRYLLGSSPTGSWTGQGGKLAVFQSGGWIYSQPREGWRLWAEDEDKLFVFDGTAWHDLLSFGDISSVSLLGVNTTADVGNRLAVSSPAVLLTHSGSDHRLKINKNAPADTGSLLFQTGFSGRAEMGLSGDDNYHLKVSADGATWKEALVVDRVTGAVTLPNTTGSDTFATRAALVTAVAGGLARGNGAITHAAGLAYRWSSGATSLPGLPGLVTSGDVSVLHYGAVVDGATNDAPAIQAAIDALPANGGDILLPPGVLAIASTIVVSKSNVRLLGVGGDNRHDTAPFILNAGSRLKWTGAVGGTMLRFTSTSGASNPKMTGGGLKGVVLDAAAVAGRCLEIWSWNSGRFEDLLLYDPTIVALDFDVVASLADARDAQENVFSRIWITALSGSADGVRMGSSTPGANPSYNTFANLVVQVNTGTGIALSNCDNNHFKHTRVTPTGGGNAVVFNGSNTNAAYVARDNVFDHLTTASPVIVRGTTSFTYAAGRNHLTNLDQTNGTVSPTVEPGARMSFGFIDGIRNLFQAIKGVFADSEANANAGYDFIAGTGVSAAIVNNANAHLAFLNSANSIRWLLRHDSNSVMTLDMATGGTSGAFQVGRPVRPGNFTLAQLAALTVAAGNVTYVSDGLKVGETSGGTGNLQYFDGTAWRYIIPASGGGTSNFLRADGTWAAPPGGGGSGISLGAYRRLRTLEGTF